MYVVYWLDKFYTVCMCQGLSNKLLFYHPYIMPHAKSHGQTMGPWDSWDHTVHVKANKHLLVG